MKLFNKVRTVHLLCKRLLVLAIAVAVMAMTVIPVYAAGVDQTFTDACSSSYKSGEYYKKLISLSLSSNIGIAVSQVAKSQIGYCESNSSGDYSGATAGSDNYTEYNRWYFNSTSNHQAWCNLFVSWCFAAAGLKPDGTYYPKNPFYLSLWRNKNAGVFSWKDYREGECIPQAGDVIVYAESTTNNKDGSSLGDSYNHIGIIVDYSNGVFYTVEGNLSNKVVSKTFTPNAETGLAYGSKYVHAIIKPSFNEQSTIGGDENLAAFNRSLDDSIAGYYYLTTNYASINSKPAAASDLVRSITTGEVIYISAQGTNSYGNVWYRTTDGYIYPKTDAGVVRLSKITAPFYIEPVQVSSINSSCADSDYVCAVAHPSAGYSYSDTTNFGCIIYEKNGSTYTEVARTEGENKSLGSKGVFYYNVTQSPSSTNKKFIAKGTSSIYSFTPNHTYYYRMFVEYSKNNSSIVYSFNYPANSEYYSFVAPAATSVTATYSDISIVDLTATSASLSYKCTVSGTSTSNVSDISIRLYSSSGTYLGAVYHQTPSFTSGANYFIARPEKPDVMNYTFRPETTYKVCICSKILGNNYYSYYVTFTTLPCDHTFDQGVVTPSTCTEYGYVTYTCTTCGFSYSDDLPLSDHTFGTDGVCTVCGYKNAAYDNYSGVCGDNVTWKLDVTTGVLTISGAGSVTSSPWSEYTEHIKSVDIAYGVMSIGDYVFAGCEGLTSITIPSSVTRLGMFAFGSCTSLASITIPDSVTMIGYGAFYDTAWYNNQPDGLVYVGKVVYKYKGTCPSSVAIKEGTLGIADNALRNCTSLTSITIPASVTIIDTYAFYGCDALSDVYYGGSESDWREIWICAENPSLASATIHYGSCNGTTGHVFDNACDTTCNVCGYVRTASHSYASVWSSDGTSHWHQCTVCGARKDNAAHNFGANGVCMVCGYVGQTAPDADKIITARAGSTFTVDVKTSVRSDKNGIGLSLSYDKALLEYVSAEWEVGDTQLSSFSDEDTLLGVAASEDKKDFGGVVCSVTFKVKDSALPCDTLISGSVKFSPGDETEYVTPALVRIKDYVAGDLNGDDSVTADDAIYLLYHVFFPSNYPVSQPVDFDKNGSVDASDAIYLLYHVFFPENYPI